MKKPMRIKTTQLLAATYFLNSEEFGALLLIMINAHSLRLRIRDNDRLLAGFALMSLRKWRKIAPQLRAIWRVDDEGFLTFDHLTYAPKKRAKK